MLLSRAALILILATAVIAADDTAPRLITYGKDAVGKLPAGWKADKTGKGEGSVWKVLADKTAPSKTGQVLAQTAAGARPVFNLCILEDSKFLNGEVRVAFKTVEGKIDQGGGVIWRYLDSGNYYLARMNPLEDNYRVYKIVAGERIQLGNKSGLEINAGEWHTLKVRHQGDKIECYLDDKKLLEATDDALAKPGKVGLWTKADAQTYFDQLSIQK